MAQPSRHTGAPPELLILILLDLYGSMPMEQLREHLPSGELRVFRLSEFGAPVIARTGPRPSPMNWPAIRRAVLALVQDAQLQPRDRSVHFIVHGMAPLAVFAYLGLLLSKWTPITVINRRGDGAVDVCPMQGPSSSGAFFDVIAGLDLTAPVAYPGRVAVFVSTGYLPEAEKLRLFVENGGDELAGLVQIRTSAMRALDGDNMIEAADELARQLSLVPSAYPFQKGITLFIAGPAQLALAAGRAVNPHIITDVRIANRGGDEPSGHELAFDELAFAVSSTQPVIDETPATTLAERPRIEELRLTGFRAFQHAKLGLDDFTALIGRNGAGKSTLLDAFDLLRDAVTDSLRNALERRGGLAELRPRQTLGQATASPDLGLALVIQLPAPSDPESADAMPSETTNAEPPTNRRAIYGFRLTAGFEGGLQIDEQLLLSGGPGFRRLAGQVESPIATISRTSAPRDGLLLPLVAGVVPEWRSILDTVSRIRVYTLSAARIRAPAPIGVGIALDREGSNAGDVLAQFEGRRADKDWILRHLGAITPGLVNIDVGMVGGLRQLYFDQRAAPSDEAAQRELAEGKHTAPNRFRAGEMSEGTLRALGILLACRQQPVPSLVLIDELEDSIHIGALHVLLDALGATIQDRCQVAITSHSTEALSHSLVTPERTRLIVWRDGRSGIFELDPGSRASAAPPDTVGSILRINGLYPAEEPTSFPADLFTLDEADPTP